MKIILDRINDKVHMRATNESGISVDMDGSAQIGGQGRGCTPMELVLSGLGGCSSIDVLTILEKQKQKVDSYRVEMDATRSDSTPSVFETAHLKFFVEGDISPDKLIRAVELSMQKYCSVSKMLEESVDITYSLFINGNKVQ